MMFLPFVAFHVRIVRSRFDNIFVRLVRSCGLGCRAPCTMQVAPRSAPPAHARLTHRRSRAQCFVGSESHDRDRDIARDDRAGRTGEVGERVCGDVPIRAAVAEAVPSPAGLSRAGEGYEEPRPGRFRAPQLPVGIMGNIPRSSIDRQPERQILSDCNPAFVRCATVGVNSQNDSILKWTYSRVPSDQFPLTSFTSLCLASVSKSVQTRTSALLL
jgi:hypothetical protein